jgi:hypothetical protein
MSSLLIGRGSRRGNRTRTARRMGVQAARDAHERLVPLGHATQRVVVRRCIGFSPTVYCSAAIAQSKKLEVAASTRCRPAAAIER